MAGSLDHLLKSYDVDDLLDEVASAEPPAFLRRCFAEGMSAVALSFARVQEIAACAMILDAIVDNRDYEFFEHELLERARPDDEEAAHELEELTARLSGA